MKHVLAALILVSIPALLMMKALQSYRYTVALEEIGVYEGAQEELLEENKRLLAGIAVFSAPERVHTLGKGPLELNPADHENVLQVQLPESIGESSE